MTLLQYEVGPKYMFEYTRLNTVETSVICNLDVWKTNSSSQV